MKNLLILILCFPFLLSAQNFSNYYYTHLPSNSNYTPLQQLDYIQAVDQKSELRLKIVESVSGSLDLAALYFNIFGSCNAYSDKLLLNTEQFHTDDLNQGVFLLSYYSCSKKDYFYENQLYRLKNQLTKTEKEVLNAFRLIHGKKTFDADSMIQVLSTALYTTDKELSTVFNRKKIAHTISFLQANTNRDIQSAYNTYNEYLNSPFNKNTSAFDFCKIALYKKALGYNYNQELELAARNAYGDLSSGKIALTDYFFIYNSILSDCVFTDNHDFFTLFVHSTAGENPLKEIEYLFDLAYPKNPKEFNTFLSIYHLYNSASVFNSAYDYSDVLFETDLQLLPANKSAINLSEFVQPESMFTFTKADYLVLITNALESILNENPNYWNDFFDPKCENDHVCLEHKKTSFFLLYQQLAKQNELEVFDSNNLQTYAMRFLK